MNEYRPSVGWRKALSRKSRPGRCAKRRTTSSGSGAGVSSSTSGGRGAARGSRSVISCSWGFIIAACLRGFLFRVGRRRLYFNVPCAFRHGQVAPVERLILHVVLAEGQGRRRFGHLEAEIEGVRRID